MSNLVEHAKRELELCGQFASDPAYAQSIVAAVAAFATFGHSGGSAEVARDQLHDLLRFRALSPITSDPSEWMDHSDISGAPLWQNIRDSAAMSKDGGQTWYYVDDRDEQGLAEGQLVKLARWIIDEFPGEPSKSESAVETAIRLMRQLMEIRAQGDV